MRSRPGNNQWIDELPRRPITTTQWMISLGAVVVCVVLRMLLQPVLGERAPFATLMPSIVLATWLAGARGGLAATVLAVSAGYFILFPYTHFPVDSKSTGVTLVSFSSIAVIISLAGEFLIGSRHRAELNAERAERTSEILRESESRKSSILKVALDSIITMDESGLVTEFNPAAEETFGYSRDEVLGQRLVDLIIPAELRDAHLSGMDRYSETGIGPILGKRLEVTAMRKDGSIFPVELAVVATKHSRGTEFTAYLRDISERKAKEAELLSSEERLRLAVEGANIGTWHLNVADNRLRISDTMYALFDRVGEETDTVEGFAAFLHPDDVARVLAAKATSLETGNEYDQELRVVWQDGSLHWLVARGRAYYGPDGKAVRMEGIVFDVTARKLAEQAAHARAEREAFLSSLEQGWRATTDPNEIQRVAVTALGNTLGADRCYFSFFDEHNGTVTIGYDFLRGDVTSLTGTYRLSVVGFDPKAHFADRRTLVIEDVEKFAAPERLVEKMRHVRFRSGVSVPLFAQGRLVASLSVEMTTETRKWAEDEIQLIQTIAEQTRVAIETAIAQERERRIATELQEALLPALPISVPRLALGSYMSPALDEAAIGGDFCDVFALDKALYAIVVGDVSGKGLAAAAQLATVRNMLRALLYEHRDPVTTAETLNSILTTNQLIIGFVTCFVGVYDAESGVLEYTSCGHEPALIRSGMTREVKLMATSGPPLGVGENAHYESSSLKLTTGDTVLIYTDGLTEAGPSRRELLGCEGLADVFRDLPHEDDLDETAEQIVAKVAEFASEGFRDDVCLLLMRRS